MTLSYQPKANRDESNNATGSTCRRCCKPKPEREYAAHALARIGALCLQPCSLLVGLSAMSRRGEGACSQRSCSPAASSVNRSRDCIKDGSRSLSEGRGAAAYDRLLGATCMGALVTWSDLSPSAATLALIVKGKCQDIPLFALQNRLLSRLNAKASVNCIPVHAPLLHHAATDDSATVHRINSSRVLLLTAC